MSIVWKPYICYTKIHAERKKWIWNWRIKIYPRKWIMIISYFHERVTSHTILPVEYRPYPEPKFTQRRRNGLQNTDKISLSSASTYITKYSCTKDWTQSKHSLFPICFDTPGVPSSRNFYVAISCPSEFVQHIKTNVGQFQLKHATSYNVTMLKNIKK